MNKNELKLFLDFAFQKVQNSAWTTDDVAQHILNDLKAEEILKWCEDERKHWKKQEPSAFNGNFYL